MNAENEMRFEQLNDRILELERKLEAATAERDELAEAQKVLRWHVQAVISAMEAHDFKETANFLRRGLQ